MMCPNHASEDVSLQKLDGTSHVHVLIVKAGSFEEKLRREDRLEVCDKTSLASCTYQKIKYYSFTSLVCFIYIQTENIKKVICGCREFLYFLRQLAASCSLLYYRCEATIKSASNSFSI